MVKDTYMVQTRSHAKAQTNTPTVQSTKPVTQKAVPKIAKIPIKKRKRRILNHCPAE